MRDREAYIQSHLRPTGVGHALAMARQDLRHAARVLMHRPGVAAVLVVTLALGIGANSTIFSAVDAVLIRPLPYPHADRLVNLFERDLSHGDVRSDVSVQNSADWRRDAKVFDDIATYFYQSPTLTGEIEARRLTGARVSVGAFRLLGIAPVVGRDFVPDDAAAGGNVAIVSWRFWQQHFTGDRAAVGRTIRLNGQPHTVVGVMPASFQFPAPEVDLWRPVPSDLTALGSSGRHFANAVARLKPGATLEQARGDMDRVAATLARTFPRTNGGWGVGVESLQESIVGGSRALLLLAWAAAILVLLIARSNAAGILVTEASARDREIAVRTALGAGRRRIAAQMLTEALLVASISGLLGIGVAALGARAVSALVEGTVPFADRITLDRRVVAFTTLTVAAVALIAGLVPAMRASSGTSAAALKESGRTTRPGRRRSFRQVFVAGQVAFALVLLVSAGLIGRSLVNLWHARTGFDSRGVIAFSYLLPSGNSTSAEATAGVHEQVLARLAAVPGVEAAALAVVLPFEGELEQYGFSLEGRPPGANDEVLVRQVSAGFLTTLRIPLLRGRQFTPFDHARGERVAIVSRTMASRYWPAGTPVGRHLTIAGLPWTVVGVAEDVPTADLATAPRPVVYVAMAQWPDVNKNVPIFGVQTLAQMSSDSIARQRFGALALVICAVVALVLAVVGIYGTVSNLVVQRTHEIGIRMAVGAAPADILKSTVGEGVALAAAGVAVGVPVAAARIDAVVALRSE